MRHFLLAVCLALAGCVSSGVQVDQSKLPQFEVGKTTEAEVVAVLGKPTSITTSNQGRFLAYGGAKAHATAASYIPIAGPFVGGVKGTWSVVMFRFDSDGKLAEITTSESWVDSSH